METAFFYRFPITTFGNDRKKRKTAFFYRFPITTFGNDRKKRKTAFFYRFPPNCSAGMTKKNVFISHRFPPNCSAGMTKKQKAIKKIWRRVYQQTSPPYFFGIVLRLCKPMLFFLYSLLLLSYPFFRLCHLLSVINYLLLTFEFHYLSLPVFRLYIFSFLLPL